MKTSKILYAVLVALLIFCCLLWRNNRLIETRAHSAGYASGYEDGYNAALDQNTRSFPVYEPIETTRVTVRPTSTPYATTVPASDDFTVYVSRNGIMHRKSSCSGMIYYAEMPYSVAKEYYTEKCSKCFK